MGKTKYFDMGKNATPEKIDWIVPTPIPKEIISTLEIINNYLYGHFKDAPELYQRCNKPVEQHPYQMCWGQEPEPEGKEEHDR